MKYYLDKECVTVCANDCKHSTGWYNNVTVKYFFGLFEKNVRVYSCQLCGCILQGEELKNLTMDK